MEAIDRRTFLRRGLAAAAGTLSFGGPFQALAARALSPSPANQDAGYGPLAPVPDLRDGVVRLHLPTGFAYRSFGYTGELMADGVTTPGRHDGMSAFPSRRGGYRLVRNHEVDGSGTAFGDPSKAYDAKGRGGTTTLQVSSRAENIKAWTSLNGTVRNCAGGAMPWGSWVSCEETISGPDLEGSTNASFTKKHGYVFEVLSSRGPNRYARARAIRATGRFLHEAVAIDPATGFLYLTEDNVNAPSGFYRYRAPKNPMTERRLTDGGTLEMLAIQGESQAELHTGRTVGETLDVAWVCIPNPDPVFPSGTTSAEAGVAVGNQGRNKGAAVFSRLEGLHYGNGVFYIVSTQGGDPPDGPSGGFGNGLGQVWAYDPSAQTITLVFESPSADVLELPDNVEVSPAGSLLLCEDGPAENYLRGLTLQGDIFDFALNAVPGQEEEEFAGSTFTPDGKTLFVNIQASSGMTFAIWGPWENGPL